MKILLITVAILGANGSPFGHDIDSNVYIRCCSGGGARSLLAPRGSGAGVDNGSRRKPGGSKGPPYWWQGPSNPFKADCTPGTCSTGPSDEENKATFTSSGHPGSSSLFKPSLHTSGVHGAQEGQSETQRLQPGSAPTGICKARHVCIHWQLCRDGYIISDGSGRIDKSLTIPRKTAATYESCGEDMICCQIPSLTPQTPSEHRVTHPIPADGVQCHHDHTVDNTRASSDAGFEPPKQDLEFGPPSQDPEFGPPSQDPQFGPPSQDLIPPQINEPRKPIPRKPLFNRETDQSDHEHTTTPTTESTQTDNPEIIEDIQLKRDSSVPSVSPKRDDDSLTVVKDEILNQLDVEQARDPEEPPRNPQDSLQSHHQRVQDRLQDPKPDLKDQGQPEYNDIPEKDQSLVPGTRDPHHLLQPSNRRVQPSVLLTEQAAHVPLDSQKAIEADDYNIPEEDHLKPQHPLHSTTDFHQRVQPAPHSIQQPVPLIAHKPPPTTDSQQQIQPDIPSSAQFTPQRPRQAPDSPQRVQPANYNFQQEPQFPDSQQNSELGHYNVQQPSPLTPQNLQRAPNSIQQAQPPHHRIQKPSQSTKQQSPFATDQQQLPSRFQPHTPVEADFRPPETPSLLYQLPNEGTYFNPAVNQMPPFVQPPPRQQHFSDQEINDQFISPQLGIEGRHPNFQQNQVQPHTGQRQQRQPNFGSQSLLHRPPDHNTRTRFSQDFGGGPQSFNSAAQQPGSGGGGMGGGGMGGGGMGGMMMGPVLVDGVMTLGGQVMTTAKGTPLIMGSCSASTFCVSRDECSPYTGFLIMDNSLQPATFENAPTVPFMPCLQRPNDVEESICCQLPHPLIGPDGKPID